MQKHIAIQGVKGSFHHIAAQGCFGQDIVLEECLSFDDTVNSLLEHKSDAVVMALENSIAGSILPNYALIDKHDLQIVGERYLDVQHCFMALPEQSINAITEVYSHPMALLQCKPFFKAYPHIKLIEDKDTAEAARRIKDAQLKNTAAIASSLAADVFGLEILAESIQANKQNETRFVILNRKEDAKVSEINKASLRFELPHKTGSLVQLLKVMELFNLNLTKIQSLPRIDTPWRYVFFVDVVFGDIETFENASSELQKQSEHFKILGLYKNGKA